MLLYMNVSIKPESSFYLLIVFLILTNFTSPLKVLLSSITLLILQFKKKILKVELFIFWFQLKESSSHALRPIIPSNTSSPRITATAGTKLVRASLINYVTIFFIKLVLQFTKLSSPIGIAGSSLRSLSKIPHCCS